MNKLLGMLFATCIAMIGYTIHHSILWSIFDFFFNILVLIKWLIYHEITLKIIHQTFDWFLN